jgi:sugar phosphate isomerase/epimerase
MTAAEELKKISFGTWTFVAGPYAGDPIPLPRVLDRLARAGYDGVEICGLPPHVTLENYGASRARRKLARLIGDHGLGISGYQADFGGVNPAVANNADRYLELVRRFVELCADLACPMLRVDTAGPASSIPDSDLFFAMNRVADIWARAAEIAAANGVALAWEFEPGLMFNKPGEVIALHQKVNQPNFKILFDTANAHVCAPSIGAPEFLKRLEGRVGALHVMDSAASLRESGGRAHRPFEEGVIDFRILGPQLMEIPIKWWCVDLGFWPGAWELLEACRDYVLAIMGAKTAA